MFPVYESDQPKRPSKTHRGRRSRPKPATVASPSGQYHVHADGSDHMGEANTHIKNAHKDPTKAGTLKHLFRALSTLKKAK